MRKRKLLNAAKIFPNLTFKPLFSMIDSPLKPGGVMVAQMVLVHLVGVRIPAGLPKDEAESLLGQADFRRTAP